MQKAGADIIDVGGESTRPGSKIIKPHDELLRVKKLLKILKNFQKHYFQLIQGSL